MPARRSPAPRYVPVKVDLDVLRADLSAFEADRGLSNSYLNRLRDDWLRWVEVCAGLPGSPDPSEAGLDAYLSLLTRDRSPGVVEALLRAVAHECAKRDVTPAFRDPALEGVWKAAQRGHRKEWNAANATSPKEGQAKPLLRKHARAIAECQPERDAQDVAWTAALLLALDTGFPLAAILSARPDQFQFTNADRTALKVRVGEGMWTGAYTATLHCDHRERSAGVPWDCTVCAISLLLDESLDHDRSAFTVIHDDRAMRQKVVSSSLGTAMRKAPHLASRGSDRFFRVLPEPGLPDASLAGLRRGLVLAFGWKSGTSWLRARAWTITAWTCGVRMNGDFGTLPRDLVTRTDTGFRIQMGVTKTDRSGARRDTHTLNFGQGHGAEALAEYLCVRDAFAGPEGYLFLTTMGPNNKGYLLQPSDRAPSAATAQHDFQRVVALARLADEGYTTYSTRRGNATQSELDGHPLEVTQSRLAHVSVETTRGYVDVDPDAVARRMMEGLAS